MANKFSKFKASCRPNECQSKKKKKKKKDQFSFVSKTDVDLPDTVKSGVTVNLKIFTL